jgi:CheY-like chemotaxis protein
MTDRAPAPAKPTVPLGDQILVLVADDDADMRLYIRGCLRSRGDIHIIEAADGDEAFALAQTLLPDLIVSDLVMPGLNGDALCRALKAGADTRDIPFLLVSGEARTAYADRFLAKPFNAAGLRAEVNQLVAPSGRA